MEKLSIYGRLVQHKAFKENSSSRLTHSFVRVSRKRSCSRFENQILSPYGKQMLLPLRSKTENNPLQMESFSQHFAFGRSSSTAEIFQFPDSSASSGGEVHRNSTQTQIFWRRRHSQLIIHYDLAQKNGMYR